MSNSVMAQQVQECNPATVGLPGMEAAGNTAMARLAGGAAPVLFGVDAGRRMFVSVTLPGHSVEEIATYLYGSPARAGEISAANGIGAAAEAGTNLVVPDENFRGPAAGALQAAGADGMTLRSTGTASTESVTGETRVYRFTVGGRPTELTEGQFRQLVQGRAHWLALHARRLRDTASGSQLIHRNYLNESNAAIRDFMEWAGGQDDLSPDVWNEAIVRSAGILSRVEDVDAGSGDPLAVARAVGAQADELVAAATALDKADSAWDRYINGTVTGGESAAHVLDIVRDMSLVVLTALIAAEVGVVVLPAATAALAAYGASGAAATAGGYVAATASASLTGGITGATLQSIVPPAQDKHTAGERAEAQFIRGLRIGASGYISAKHVEPAFRNLVSQHMFGASFRELSRYAQRAVAAAIGDAAAAVPMGVISGTVANLADLVSGRIGTEEYLDRIGWFLVYGVSINAVMAVVGTPLRAAAPQTPPTPAAPAPALPAPATTASASAATASVPAVAAAPAQAAAREVDMVIQPVQVDRQTGVVAQQALHRPSGQVVEISYNPGTGAGQVVNQTTGDRIAVIVNGEVIPTVAGRLSAM